MTTATQTTGQPWKHGTGWRVPSASRAEVAHFVSGDLRRCTCAGFAYGRGKPCRHIRAVRLFLKEVIRQD